MATSQLKNKQIPVEGSQQSDNKQWFSNPISKNTFEALPKIYGTRRKKKLSIKRQAIPFFQSEEDKKHPNNKQIGSIQRQSSEQGPSIPITFEDNVHRRFKTQMKSYDRKSTQRLSSPKSDFCTKRYCFCNKQHQNQLQAQRVTRSATKLKIKPKPSKLSPLKPINKKTSTQDLKQFSEPDCEGETKHKVATCIKNQEENQMGETKQLSLLDLLRSSQQETNRSNQKTKKLSPIKRDESSKKVNVEIQFPLVTNSIEVQTQNILDNVVVRQTEAEESPLKGKTLALENCLPDKHSKKAASSLEHRPQHRQEAYKLPKGISMQAQNLKLQKLRAKFNQMEMLDSDSDDGKSVRSSISSASISKHIFDSEKKSSNTMFHTLNKQEGSARKSSKSQKGEVVVKEKKDKYVYQKKNGLFIIPEEDEYVDFLKGYQPMNQKFAIKKLVRKQNFKVVPSDDGVYFGQYVNDERNGKGLLVTERTIFEGKYKNNQKTYGCEKNVDGVYKGEFVDGVREGYGTFEWYNGEVFEGQWKNGTKNGFGIWRSPRGDFYQGNWLLNRQHGKGTFHHRTSTYRGEFTNFLKDGHGEQFFSNGDKYIGSYKQGKPDGQGKYQWADGSYYQGHFVSGLRQGNGKWVYNNGTIYEGEFTKDFKNGYGRQTYKQGQSFEGVFKEGNKYQGILIDKDKNRIRIKPDN